MLKITIVKSDDTQQIKYVNKARHFPESGGLTVETVVEKGNMCLNKVTREFISFDDCLMIQIEEEA